MNCLRLASPWALALLPVAWAVVLYAALGPVRAGRGRRPGARLRAATGCAATALLVAALSGPSLRLSSADACPVILVQDTSASMSPGGRPAIGPEVLAPWAAAVPRGQAGLVRFDAQARVSVHPLSAESARLADGAGALPPLPAGEAAAETDVEAGLRLAAAALPGGRGLLLLCSDARETRGDAVAAAARLAAQGVRVHALAPDVSARDVRVVGVRSAGEARAGGPVRLEVRVAATAPVGATVHIERPAAGPAPAWRQERDVDLQPGVVATLLFEDPAPGAGVHEYRAEVSAPGNGWPRNNRASCIVRTGETADWLYVYAGDAPARTLAALQAQAPADVRLRAVRAADGLPMPAGGRAAVVLDNVSAWALGPAAAARLAERVTQGGLGVIALGGDAAFGAGGYGESPLEPLLPVTSRPGERPPLAMVLVVDSSGSMNETVGAAAKLALAKEAVLSLRPALGEADRVGVVAFAGQPRVVSALRPAAEWEALRADVLALVAGGGTRLTPAVEAALPLLAGPAAPARAVRHVLLLSDGRSQDFDLPRLVRLCRDAGATLSAVATGADADRDRLGLLARDTGGRLYVAADLGRLAETFLRDMAWARGDGLREEARPSAWVRPEPVWPSAGPPLPPTEAHNATRAKEGADVHWAAPDPRDVAAPAAPLLATWRRGLGKAAAMPWPVHAAADAWTAGDLLGRRLRDVLDWLAASSAPGGWDARLVDRDGVWVVRVEEAPAALAAGAGTGRGPAFRGTVFAAVGAEPPGDLVFEQVAPGVHEASAGCRGGPAAEVAVCREAAPEEVVRLAVPGAAPREFEAFGVDRGRLEAIVRAGGGQVHDSPASLAEAVRRHEGRAMVPVGLHLVWAAMVVAAVQVALRLLGLA